MTDIFNNIIGGLAVVTVSTAFVDQDRRGLAFFTEPEIFAVEESAESTQPAVFPVVWGAPLVSNVNRQSNPVDRFRSNRRAALSPNLQPLSTLESPAEPFARDRREPFTQSETVLPSDLPQSVQEGTNLQSTPPVSNPAPVPTQGVATLPLPQVVPVITPSVPGLLPGSTIVVTPVTAVPPTTPGNPSTPTVDPVIPAVPEPSSWLMMILGVGFLGLMLRYRREDLDMVTDSVMRSA